MTTEDLKQRLEELAIWLTRHFVPYCPPMRDWRGRLAATPGAEERLEEYLSLKAEDEMNEQLDRCLQCDDGILSHELGGMCGECDDASQDENQE